MRYLILLLILIPAGEIGFLLLSGHIIGILPTISLIIFTGVVGAYLAKKQGMETIRKAQEQLRFGRMPGEELLDGICIIIGGTLLLTPGFLTDVFGLVLLIPQTRIYFKKLLTKFFRDRLDKGRITIIR
ncbi:FxsA family protein [Bacillus sp. 1NLA3E]|uniref:FxsA family protein n=1 Tax=Bacillus sp. 1NLA3E TaxID=666686 RepID=UPI000247E7B2|nr:FxsA family protein [Bacillus sp. 1NLA3E]AGK55178.1 phage T7 F exclusion suppressor FxsA [Bacillus sp. 1NLA3E]